MINNSNIKFNARLRLRGKWPAVLCILGLTCGMTIAPSLLQVLQSLFIGEMPEPEAAFSASNAELLEIALKALISIFISLAVFTAQILLVNPISMGQYSYYWKNADGQEPQPDTVFMWFRKGRYSRAVCTVLLVNLFKTLWGLLCLSPAVFSALFTIGLASTVKPSVLVLLAFFLSPLFLPA